MDRTASIILSGFGIFLRFLGELYWRFRNFTVPATVVLLAVWQKEWVLAQLVYTFQVLWNEFLPPLLTIAVLIAAFSYIFLGRPTIWKKKSKK